MIKQHIDITYDAFRDWRKLRGYIEMRKLVMEIQRHLCEQTKIGLQLDSEQKSILQIRESVAAVIQVTPEGYKVLKFIAHRRAR